MKGIISTILVVVLLLAAAERGHAVTLSYNFDSNNAGLAGGPWATITLTDTTYNGLDAVRFQVDPLEEAFYRTYGNFGLQTFYFNSNTNQPDSALRSSQVADWRFIYSPGSVGAFKKFELLYQGDGDSRQDPLDFYLYTSSFDIKAEQFAVSNAEGYMFAGHIADFGILGKPNLTSAKFASSGAPAPAPIPEPGTVTLFAIGLAALACCSRRRKRN